MSEFEFENELRRLRPTLPSPALEMRIAQKIRRTPPLHSSPDWFARLFPRIGWALAGAAATVIFIALQEKPPAGRTVERDAMSAPSEIAVFEPEGSTSEILSAEDRGLVFTTGDREPAQLVRYTSLERHFYNNPVTGARLEIEIPREDLLYVPVATQ